MNTLKLELWRSRIQTKEKEVYIFYAWKLDMEYSRMKENVLNYNFEVHKKYDYIYEEFEDDIL